MKISIVVATDEKGVIGYRGKLPWNLPEDLRHFRELTMGKYILMGRKTFESIGKALPGRVNIVVSRDNKFNAKKVVVFGNVEKAIEYAERKGEKELMVIGGEQIYKQCANMAEKMYLTVVYGEHRGDRFFKVDWDSWLIKKREGFEKYETYELERRKK